MVFSSIVFLFTFLPIMLLAYYIAPKKIKNFVLLIGSLIFYAWGEPVYIFLMIFTTISNYILARIIALMRKENKRKMYLIITIVLDLAILGFFKYWGLLIDTINGIFSTSISYTQLALPIGISFYTFQALSYVIDVYLKKVEVQKNIIDFGAYITMFPQLVAGPIVRYSDIATQLKSREHTINGFGIGVEKFIIGLGKKVLLANNIGMLWNTIQAQSLSELSVLTAWLGAIAYTLQIYFDFSGYSDMAVGLGRMFGFKFIKNFDYPYISKSVTEFWRRWHISLSSWFKEYVYIPLGGNRKGTGKQIRNLLIVWGLTGLWHGASYNFIIWGLYYGVLLIIEKFILGKYIEKLPNIIKNIYTMLIVIIGWVFFASPDLGWAVDYIKVLFGIGKHAFIDGNFIYYIKNYLILLIILIIASRPFVYSRFSKLKKKDNSWAIIAAIIEFAMFAIVIAYLLNASYNPFLYFRF
ncbi:MBOAT family protein [Clostridium sp. MSJ-8]|uniref:MBOAT family O-acyltransferase n=1 Tax=Clostridium sp. MSJ-8 TaxID=2841510 RepID=UPI001C0F11E3|nr:MBOAT family O-acyltransferase [Clostridium sp. MSJ-8]MBU5487398.1 MBOAT family protein [Clostridium sp. MSJ-8]